MMQLYAQDVVGFIYAAAWMAIVMSFALPLAAAGAMMTIFSICFLFWYVICCITWWSMKGVVRRVWRILPLPSFRHARRCNTHETVRYLDLKIASPLSFATDLSPHALHETLKKTDSLQSLVGTGLDRDFEGLGGWASAQDDDGLWMAKPWDSEDLSVFTARQHRRSVSPSTRRSSMSIAPEMRTPSRLPEGISRTDAYFPSLQNPPTPRSRRHSMHRRNNMSTASFSTIRDDAL